MGSTSMRIVTAVAATVLLGNCGDAESQPAVCQNYASVQASADDLRNADNSENGLSQVRTDLQELRRDLGQLLDDVSAPFQTQVDTIRSAAGQLATAVTAARADPNATTLAAVGEAAAWLRETVHRLATAMGETC
jgi:hypothetical protein